MLTWIFSRKGALGFSWASTADDVTAGISAAGLVVVVTGASSGIGADAGGARGPRRHGRQEPRRRGDRAPGSPGRDPAASVDVMELDLSSLASVHSFAADFAARGLPLNILMKKKVVHKTTTDDHSTIFMFRYGCSGLFV